MSATDRAAEYLVVALDDSRFALRATTVEAAVAPRPVTPLPFVADWVEGLVSVSDRVLPLLALRALLAPGTEPAQQTELVVLETTRAPCALRVDRVVASVQVDDVEVMAAAPADTGADDMPTLVAGRFMLEGVPVLVLDGDALGALVSPGELPAGRRGLLARARQGVDDVVVQEEHCIVVACAGERYGIRLVDAVEILDLAATTPVPAAPSLVEGVAIVRGEVLLVLSLSTLLGRPQREDAGRSVVVVERAGMLYGLRVAEVEGIVAWDPGCLRRLDGEAGELAGVLVDGERAIGMIGIERLLNEERCLRLAPFLPARRVQADARSERLHALLEVDVAGEAFGIPLASVRRIARYSGSLRIEQEEGGQVAGAVNIAGVILPVVDLESRLSLPATALAATAAWIIVGLGEREWALAVNEARRIVEVPDSRVEELGGGGRRMVSAVARVEERLVTLLDVGPLLEAG